MNKKKILSLAASAKLCISVGNPQKAFDYLETIETECQKTDGLPEKMILKAKNQKFNKLVAKYQKITNAGGRHCEEVIKDIDDYTHSKLLDAGFSIQTITKFGDYMVYKICWYGKETD